jgi:hypothetical protein
MNVRFRVWTEISASKRFISADGDRRLTPTLEAVPCSCSLTSLIALEDVGAEYTTQRIDLVAGEQRSPAYLAINPKGRLPMPVTERGKHRIGAELAAAPAATGTRRQAPLQLGRQ